MIYFAQTQDNRAIKIGYAADVAKRLEALRTSSPDEIKLLGTMPGNRLTERELHHRFAYARQHREWFRADPALVRFAVKAQMLAGLDDSASFLSYAIAEPGLLDLYITAASVQDDPVAPWFCANAVFFGFDGEVGLKPRIEALVGWHAASPALRNSSAYDVVYDAIYDALPNCRGCSCL